MLLRLRRETWQEVAEALMLFAECHQGDKIEEHEMGRTCSTHGRAKRCVGLEEWWEDVDWINLAHGILWLLEG